MPSPALLLCDTDILLQVFLLNEIRLLKHLKASFAIQPALVMEVDLEVRWNYSRYRDRFVPDLDKALNSGLLCKLDAAKFQTYLSTAPPGASWSNFQALGAQYYGYVQRGEAYTFAAAVSLGMPAVSNDFRAIQTLEAKMLSLPCPVLRCFDLVAFALECGVLELNDCERIRSELLRRKEHVPKVFQNASFEDGLKSFTRRLYRGQAAAGRATDYSGLLRLEQL